MQGDHHPKTDASAGSHLRARRLANPPGSLRSPVPPKGRTSSVWDLEPQVAGSKLLITQCSDSELKEGRGEGRGRLGSVG